GCGSSREHAVYALWDYGFRAVIAPSFGDIFFSNCFKNGLLPIVLPAEQVKALQAELTQRPGAGVVVDLERQEGVAPSGNVHRFEVDSFRKQCLLQGLDEIALTLSHDADIAAFERKQAEEVRWLQRRRSGARCRGCSGMTGNVVCARYCWLGCSAGGDAPGAGAGC